MATFATADTDTAVPGQFAQYSASDATVRNPVNPTRRVRAVLFDVDGTLYDQRSMRLLMAVELGGLALTRPFLAPAVWRGLSAYRSAQERLRGQIDASAARQLESAAQRVGMTAAELAVIVDEWMIERPLKYLARCRAEGLIELLEFLRTKQVQLGVLSDYPS